MSKIFLKIEGIHCDACRNTIRKNLLEFDNIKDVKFDKNISEI